MGSAIVSCRSSWGCAKIGGCCLTAEATPPPNVTTITCRLIGLGQCHWLSWLEGRIGANLRPQRGRSYDVNFEVGKKHPLLSAPTIALGTIRTS
jgi:hypothetical protein